MKIYVLRSFSYDWYEFEEFEGASKKVEKLEKLTVSSGLQVVFNEEDHIKLRQGQSSHYYIKEVELI